MEFFFTSFHKQYIFNIFSKFASFKSQFVYKNNNNLKYCQILVIDKILTKMFSFVLNLFIVFLSFKNVRHFDRYF